jgi:uncharacterized membrane protein YfhO
LESIRVDAEAVGGATLVVADAWWPGWEATLDGKPTPVFPADGVIRAIRWPPGRHVLEMHYRPPEAKAGAIASAIGLALVAAWVMVGRTARGAAAGLGLRLSAPTPSPPQPGVPEARDPL